MIRVELPLADPEKLFRPITELILGVIADLVAEGLVAQGDQQKAADGVTPILPELLKWNLSFRDKSGRPRAYVSVDVKDDAAARTMIRHAALEAVRLKA